MGLMSGDMGLISGELGADDRKFTTRATPGRLLAVDVPPEWEEAVALLEDGMKVERHRSPLLAADTRDWSGDPALAAIVFLGGADPFQAVAYLRSARLTTLVVFPEGGGELSAAQYQGLEQASAFLLPGFRDAPTLNLIIPQAALLCPVAVCEFTDSPSRARQLLATIEAVRVSRFGEYHLPEND